ncbi:MAG: hypothetical protein HYY30_10935 [Chloroflexi bacterium]|nr:hypothetical protein [Chloroflexota bacterium]
MRRKAPDDLIAQYVDGLKDSADAAGSIVGLAERREIEALLPVIQRARKNLVPVAPSERFSTVLWDRLAAAWHEQRRQERVQSGQRREFFLRAAAIGSFVSFAALVAVAVRSRGGNVRL